MVALIESEPDPGQQCSPEHLGVALGETYYSFVHRVGDNLVPDAARRCRTAYMQIMDGDSHILLQQLDDMPDSESCTLKYRVEKITPVVPQSHPKEYPPGVGIPDGR